MPDGYGDLHQMLDRRLTSIEEGQQAIRTDVAVIKERQVDLIKDISGVKTTLYGNGQPGLVTKLELVKQKLQIYAGWVGGVAGTVTGAIGAIVVALLTK